MAINESSWDSTWSVSSRIWITRAGNAVLGHGRMELLEGIDRWRSISAAARQMGMSYRHAWLLVQKINEAAGEALVFSAVGGRSGGGAELSDKGREIIRLFRDAEKQVEQTTGDLVSRLTASNRARDVHIAAAASLEDVLGRLLADYSTEHKEIRVRSVFGATDELAEYILAGAPVDLFLMADDIPLDRLRQAGIVDGNSQKLLAGNSLTAIAPAAGQLKAKNAADLTRLGLKRIALAGPASPLGRYSESYLRSARQFESVAKKAVFADNARSVVSAVRAGWADAGLVYHSDAISAAGCRILFRIPRTSASIHYSAAVLLRGSQTEEARRLLDYFVSTPAQRHFRQCGFSVSSAAK